MGMPYDKDPTFNQGRITKAPIEVLNIMLERTTLELGNIQREMQNAEAARTATREMREAANRKVQWVAEIRIGITLEFTSRAEEFIDMMLEED